MVEQTILNCSASNQEFLNFFSIICPIFFRLSFSNLASMNDTEKNRPKKQMDLDDMDLTELKFLLEAHGLSASVGDRDWSEMRKKNALVSRIEAG